MDLAVAVAVRDEQLPVAPGVDPGRHVERSAVLAAMRDGGHRHSRACPSRSSSRPRCEYRRTTCSWSSTTQIESPIGRMRWTSSKSAVAPGAQERAVGPRSRPTSGAAAGADPQPVLGVDPHVRRAARGPSRTGAGGCRPATLKRMSPSPAQLRDLRWRWSRRCSSRPIARSAERRCRAPASRSSRGRTADRPGR